VWKYRRSSDKSFVAIKKVNSCSRFDASWRLDGEAAVMALLAKNGSHHVIPFYGSFVDCDGYINLSMKYLDKGSLADLLSTQGRLVMPAVSVLALHLLSALDYFHNELNLLHRDIKPSNIMIEDDGRFVLADLALAILANSGSTPCNSPVMAGTMEYMSPECLIDGIATTASDMWSFGIVLLQSLLGYFPLDKSAAIPSSDCSAAPQAELAFDSTSQYWQLSNILASVKSPICLPSVRQELDALGLAYDVQVLDFFDRCLHPV
jgi:serine/threonine protein kinase